MIAFSLHDLLKNCYRRHYTHESLKRNKNQKMLGVFTKVKNAYVKVFQVRKACEESFNSPDNVDKFI